MPSLFDYLERAFVGPIMTQKDFHMKVLIPNVRKVVKEYDIAYDPETPVSANDALADRLFAAYDKRGLMAQFPWLFVDHPMQAVPMRDWAEKEIGAGDMLDDATIMELLGWSPRARLKAISRGILRRARRYLENGVASCRKILQA